MNTQAEIAAYLSNLEAIANDLREWKQWKAEEDARRAAEEAEAQAAQESFAEYMNQRRRAEEEAQKSADYLKTLFR